MADSRATWDTAPRQTVEDSLRKILFVGPKMAIAYSGSVAVAKCVATEIRKRTSKGGRKAALHRLVADLPRLARACHAKNRKSATFLFAGVEDGQAEVWLAESPSFSVRRIAVHKSAAIGSGAGAVSTELEERLPEIESSAESLKDRADQIRNLLESQLRKSGEDTVGGLFQGITVAEDGIRPLTYGYTSLDPQSTAPSMSMEFENGTWVQRNELTGRSVPVVDPAWYASTPSGVVVQDFVLPDDKEQTAIWHLCYLVPCLRVTVNQKAVEFKHELGIVVPKRYPVNEELLLAIGLWGSPGDVRVAIKCTQSDGSSEVVVDARLNIPHAIEVTDLLARAPLTVRGPGPVFFECEIDGQLLGRRPIYFGQQLDGPGRALTPAEGIKRAETSMRAVSDSSLPPSGAALSYWSVCREVYYDKQTLRFEGEAQAIYWKDYPLKFRTSFAAGIRVKPGKHAVRVHLVNATSKAVTPSETATVDTSGDLDTVRVHGETVVSIPGPGWYFFNLYVDDLLVGSSMISAETEKAHFSYSLLPEDVARVARGELLVLTRRSPSKQEMDAASAGAR